MTLNSSGLALITLETSKERRMKKRAFVEEMEQVVKTQAEHRSAAFEIGFRKFAADQGLDQAETAVLMKLGET